MPSGHPDFRRGIDIEQQSLTELECNIVAQTIGSLSVDIIAQAIENLNINVNAQTLPQLQQRPRLGVMNIAKAEVNVSPVDNEILISIEGKGQIYGVVIVSQGDESLYQDYSKTKVDGIESTNPTWEEMFLYGLGDLSQTNWKITNYDIIAGRFVLARPLAISFESEYIETYYNVGAVHTAQTTIYVAYTLSE